MTHWKRKRELFRGSIGIWTVLEQVRRIVIPLSPRLQTTEFKYRNDQYMPCAQLTFLESEYNRNWKGDRQRPSVLIFSSEFHHITKRVASASAPFHVSPNALPTWTAYRQAIPEPDRATKESLTFGIVDDVHVGNGILKNNRRLSWGKRTLSRGRGKHCSLVVSNSL